MTFEKDKYLVVKNFLDQDWCNFINSYFNLKYDAVSYLRNDCNLNLYGTMGYTGKDAQSDNYFYNYGDMLTDTLLLYLNDIIGKYINLKLIPTYSYMRIYKQGAILKKHKDRSSCEISATLNISGGKKWPIYVQNKNKPIKINLDIGDILIYKGMEVLHWREELKEKSYTQIFLHYNNINGQFGKSNLFDNRKFLGTLHNEQPKF